MIARKKYTKNILYLVVVFPVCFMETLFKTSSVGMQQIGGVPVLCALTIALAISLFLFPLLHLLLFMSCNEKIPFPVLLTQTWSFTTSHLHSIPFLFDPSSNTPYLLIPPFLIISV